MKLQLSNIQKSFGAKTVLAGANFQVRDNEKIALVGRNGCGKTTLMKIICGQENYDSGTRMVLNGTNIGYLAQITFVDEEKTVYEELLTAFDKVRELEKQLNEQAEVLKTDSSEKQLAKYDALQTRFEALNGYQYEVELKNVFFHFQFDENDLNKKLCEFSSGQKTRIALVKLLLTKPDILLLDEPTNHLDIAAIEWLENYVKHYPFAVVLVSHDRMFLDHVVDEIVEIEFGKTQRYVGDYSHYLKAKDEYLKKNHEAYIRQQQEIHRLEDLIEKFRYKKNKAAFAKSKQKYLDRMDRIEDSTSDTSQMKAVFTCARKGGKQVLEVEDLQVGYDKVLSDVSFQLLQGQRMAIVGPNGIGKSTLIKTLVKELPAISGSFKFWHQIDVGYFNQESAQMKSNKNVLDELWDMDPEATQTQIRNTLASFLFTQDEVFIEVNDLSGGERVRLALAKLMLEHDNVLLLDEPTNHLDIQSKEIIKLALQKFEGTIIVISHDREFLQGLCDKIFEFRDGSMKEFLGNINEYLEYRQKESLREISAEKSKLSQEAEIKAEEKKESATNEAKSQQNANVFVSKEQKNLQNKLKKIEEKIADYEKEIAQLESIFAKSNPSEAELKKYQDLQDELAATMQEWEDIAEKLG